MESCGIILVLLSNIIISRFITYHQLILFHCLTVVLIHGMKRLILGGLSLRWSGVGFGFPARDWNPVAIWCFHCRNPVSFSGWEPKPGSKPLQAEATRDHIWC